MYIDEYALLRLAGVEEWELQGNSGKELNSGQISLVAALYLGNKINDLQAALNNYDLQQKIENLSHTLASVDAHLFSSSLEMEIFEFRNVLSELLKTWREKHEMPEMRLLLQKIHSYHRRQS